VDKPLIIKYSQFLNLARILWYKIVLQIRNNVGYLMKYLSFADMVVTREVFKCFVNVVMVVS